MRRQYSNFFRGLLLVVVVAAHTFVSPLENHYAFASSPAAGACSDGSGEVICNVSGEQLDFSRTSSPTAVTQTSSSSSVDIGVGLALDSVIRYEAVFTGSDGTVVDALVTIDSLPGGAGNSTYIMDQDRDSANGIKPIDMSNLQGTLSVEVSFVDDSDSAVKLQNMQVVTKDLDLGDQESAEFSGLVSYSLSSGSHIRVDDSVSGVRKFTSVAEVGLSDEKGWVSVTFPTTSTVGLTGNISATARSIPFDFDSRTVWSSSPTVTTVAAASYEVSFDLDGGSGDLPAAVSGTGELTFPSGAGQSKGGFNISGWSSGSGGSGTRVALGGGYTPISDTTFYAVYGYLVSFDANGGSGSMSAQTVNSGVASAINANSFNRSGYSFSGWNTAANGSGTAYSNGANIITSQSVTLYAQWAEEFDVTFDSNGGSGSMSAQTAGGSTELTANAFTRTSYAFAGWNTVADGSGTAYADGAAFPFTADDTLFAQWTLVPNTSTPTPYSGPLITDIGEDNIAAPYQIFGGQKVRVDGERLSSVTKVFIDGKEGAVVSTADDHFIVTLPASLEAGKYDLEIQSSIGNLTYLDALTIIDAPDASEYGDMTAWTKKISDTQVKVYVKYPTVGQKLRISHQTGGSGEYQTVFVKTIESETDSPLITNANGSYVVRTIDLDQINRIRVTVGDNTEVQVRYNR